jgi:2-oxoglutarate dehydrogenase E1 component
MQVVNTTTPANQFHALRRQIKRNFRKPLICFTPKKLLRYPSCVSTIEDFVNGTFQEVIDDNKADVKMVKRLVFCSGKIYYELDEQREMIKANDIAIIRLEQLYPLPIKKIDEIIKKYSNASAYYWVQEEPENMGAWSFIFRKLRHIPFQYIGRPESASPATGYVKIHYDQSVNILNQLFQNAFVVNH